MKGIYTDADLCPVCKRKHITYDRMRITSDKKSVCSKECKSKYEENLKSK